MSGHSKFANIKHKKEKNDAAKGKIFTVIGREIAVAVKEGGPDPANNSKLRDVIAKAKANNMPNDTIDRGIKKAAGDANSVNYEVLTYDCLLYTSGQLAKLGLDVFYSSGAFCLSGTVSLQAWGASSRARSLL